VIDDLLKFCCGPRGLCAEQGWRTSRGESPRQALHDWCHCGGNRQVERPRYAR
jgi:hypothetical protein